MKRGIFYALLCATTVGALALALVGASFSRPRLAQRLLFAPGGKAWFAPAHSNAEIVTQANQAVVTFIATRATHPQNANANEALIPQQNTETNVQRGTGTGFLIDAEGYLVTNDHVIRGADRIRSAPRGTSYLGALSESAPSSYASRSFSLPRSARSVTASFTDEAASLTSPRA